jgi:outer membrane protein OmpA-like peptidoglycan-associated protein
VLERGVVHLRGTLPDWDVADHVVERLGQVMGRENVSAGHRLDSAVPVPSSIVISTSDGLGPFDADNARMGSDLTFVLDLVHLLLASYPRVEVTLAGHLGEHEDDLAGARLARERTRAVTAYLEFKRVDLGRVHGLEDESIPPPRRIELRIEHLLD